VILLLYDALKVVISIMNINERVKLLRKNLKLTQSEFGEKISVAQSYLASIESGKRDVTEKISKLICSLFNVNEEWFKNGIGEMFVESDSTIFTALSNEYKLDELDQKIIKAYLHLDSSKKDILKELISEMIASTTTDEKISNDIDTQVENYRKELEAEAKGATSSALVKPKESAS
jgi:transcriptional regulator with XRE-family HTH domain